MWAESGWWRWRVSDGDDLQSTHSLSGMQAKRFRAVVVDRDPHFGSTSKCRHYWTQMWVDLLPGKRTCPRWARGYGSGPDALSRQVCRRLVPTERGWWREGPCVWASLR